MLVAPMPPQTTTHHYSLPSDPPDRSTTTHSPLPQPPSAPSSHNMSCLAPAQPGTSRPSIPSRPKLTLQTSSLPKTFGRSTTGLSLSLAGGSTASPTVRNTFKNAYDVATCQTPSTTAPSPSKSFSPLPTRSSKPSTSLFSPQSPYQQPLGVKSILRNSPLDPTCQRRSATTASAGAATRRVFFPAKKQVSYRQPLEEEIQTTSYTARHSDLTDEPAPAPAPPSSHDPEENEDEDEDSDSNASQNTDASSTEDEDRDAGSETGDRRARKKRKHLGAERQIRAVALMDGLEGDGYTSTPQTPRNKRAKRRCEWKWTLGPLEMRNKAMVLQGDDDDAAQTETASEEKTQSQSQPQAQYQSPGVKDGISPATSCDSDFYSLSNTSPSQPNSTRDSSVQSEIEPGDDHGHTEVKSEDAEQSSQ